MKTYAQKELDRIRPVMENLRTRPGLDAGQKKHAEEFLEMIASYYHDGVHFFQKEEFLESFECFVYAWGWLDAGARMGFFQIPPDLKKHFKIDQ